MADLDSLPPPALLAHWQIELTHQSSFIEQPINGAESINQLCQQAPGTINTFKDLLAKMATAYQTTIFEALNSIAVNQKCHVYFRFAEQAKNNFICSAQRINNAAGNIYIIGYIEKTVDQSPIQLPDEQAAKINALSQIGSAVAHDYNNIFNTISGHIELLQLQLQKSPQLLKRTYAILKAKDRGIALSERLSAVSRVKNNTKKTLNLNSFLTFQAFHLKQLIGDTYQIKTYIESDLVTAQFNEQHLTHCLAVLCQNAADAMPEGGIIEIHVTRPHDDPNHLLITILDSGSGVDKKMAPHIFEPFISDKPKSIGLGLALASVYQYMQESSGFIKIQPRQPTGTSFSLYFPIGATRLSA